MYYGGGAYSGGAHDVYGREYSISEYASAYDAPH